MDEYIQKEANEAFENLIKYKASIKEARANLFLEGLKVAQEMKNINTKMDMLDELEEMNLQMISKILTQVDFKTLKPTSN